MSAKFRQAPRRQRLRKALVLTSFLLFPITLNFLSPYVIIAGAMEGIVNGSLIVFGLLFVGSLFFGRLWCGWICPGAGMAEVSSSVNNAPFVSKRGDWIKWAIWAPWILLIVGLAVQAGGYRSVNPLYLTESGISVDEPVKYIIYFTVIGLFVGLSIAFGRRAGCHTICWMAPFMILGRWLRNRGRWPSLRLQGEPGKCSDCLSCTRGCPMSLDVHAMVQRSDMEDSECILCGTCVDGCSHGAIRFTFSAG